MTSNVPERPWKLPPEIKSFRYHISDLAVRKFRERCSNEHSGKSDHDVAMLIDQRIFEAIMDKRVTDVVDADFPDQDTKVVSITIRGGIGHDQPIKNYAVMRTYKPNGYPSLRCVAGPGGIAPAVITLVTEDMGARNFSDNRWAFVNRPLATKLADIVITPQPQKEPPAPATKEIEMATTTRPRSPQPSRPPKSMTSTQRMERINFARAQLMLRPSMPINGADGLKHMLKTRYGISLDHDTMSAIKLEVERTLVNHGNSPVPLPRLPSEADPMSWTNPVSPIQPPTNGHANGHNSGNGPSMSTVALELGKAMEDESSAKLQMARVEEELANIRAVYLKAKAKCELLMQRMQELRS